MPRCQVPRRHTLRHIRDELRPAFCNPYVARWQDAKQENAHCTEFSVPRDGPSIRNVAVDPAWRNRVFDGDGLACRGQDTGSSDVEGIWMRRHRRRAPLARLLLWCRPATTGGFGIAAGIGGANRAGTIAVGRFARQAADIRESVLSGATRCGELDDDRNWLDCYYATAQPMRAFLHLVPAPQSNPMLQNLGIAGAHSVSISDQTPNIPKDSFGLSNDTSRSKSVTSRMTSYEFNKKGTFTVTLSNGEIWRQLTGDTSFAHWNEQPQKYIIRISRGLLGSYNLEARNNPGMFKVHRIQ